MMLSTDEWQVVLFSLQLALASTIVITPPGIALAWLLARRDFRGKAVVETLVALPLVIPPVATGVLLLELLARRGIIGRLTGGSFEILFTWRAVVIAMAIMSLPLLVRNARVAFEEVDRRLEQIARTLGASEWRVLLSISLPLAIRGIIGGIVFAFARALGEFGATIVVAGHIPQRTSTIATTIYQRIELGDDAGAMRLLIVAAVIAFTAVWTSESLLRARRQR